LKIYVTMKSLAKRKSYLENVEYHLNKIPNTLQELITEFVSINVQTYNEQNQKSAVAFLTKQEVDDRAAVGKVSFGEHYNDEKANLETSIQTALQAFEDGLFKVFINDMEHDNHTPLFLKEGDQLVFIKLTMLAGRMW
jgi:hypothetical protein